MMEALGQQPQAADAPEEEREDVLWQVLRAFTMVLGGDPEEATVPAAAEPARDVSPILNM